MRHRTSPPRLSAVLTLVTGFALTASALAQYGADAPSVYSRRSTAAPDRRPQRQAYPSGAREGRPRSSAAAANGYDRPPRRPLYLQSPRPQDASGAPGRGPQRPGSPQFARQAPLRGVAPRSLAQPQPHRDERVMPAFYPAPVGKPPAEAAAKAEKSPAIPAQLVALPGEHQLLPAVRWAKTGIAKLKKIQDYSCTLVKRERINGTLGEHEFMFVKVRHEPFSVYVYFLGPARVKGQEAIYVRGRNDGNILAHPVGLRKKLVGTVSLKPDSMLAMSGNRYPMTELGLMRLTERLIEVGEHDSHFGECEVKVTPGAKINQRECTCIQVVHPVPRKEFLFHLAKIYVDSEYNLPTRYEAYVWPEEAGGPPVLTEEYTYLNLKFNNGFTDKDFDTNNPDYDFD